MAPILLGKFACTCLPRFSFCVSVLTRTISTVDFNKFSKHDQLVLNRHKVVSERYFQRQQLISPNRCSHPSMAIIKCCIVRDFRVSSRLCSSNRDGKNNLDNSNDISNIKDELPLFNKQKFDQTRTKFKETREKFKEKLEDTILKENIFTVPNFLCVTRIVLSPFLAYLILQNNFELALGLFVFAGATDLMDGYIARNFKNQQSMFGSFLDPMADKFLVLCLFLSLTYNDLIPVPLTFLIIARDICLFGSGFYIRYLSLPPPKTLWRYFDASLATAKLSPTTISKINTAVQLTLVACTIASPVFHLESESFFHLLWYTTAITTTISGFSYIFSKKTYHLLKQIKKPPLD